MSSQVLPAQQSSGWLARLDIEIVRRGARCELGRREHVGPLRLQRPFYPEGDAVPHLYLLHPPGGLVGGDRAEIELCVRSAAQVLVTTPAAQKVYRSAGAQSTQRVVIQLAEGAAAEWLPAETIVFDGARAALRTAVELAPSAAFIGWEVGCFGRPASGIAFARGQLRQSFELRRAGAPLLLDRLHVDGGSDALGAAWGHAGLPVFGNLYAVPRENAGIPAMVERLRSAVEADPCVRWAVSDLEELLVARALAPSVEALRVLFARLWTELRPLVLGRAAQAPRIWAT